MHHLISWLSNNWLVMKAYLTHIEYQHHRLILIDKLLIRRVIWGEGGVPGLDQGYKKM